MRVELHNYVSTCELHVDPETTMNISKDDNGKYTLKILGYGKVSGIVVMDISELQVRNLGASIINYL